MSGEGDFLRANYKNLKKYKELKKGEFYHYVECVAGSVMTRGTMFVEVVHQATGTNYRIYSTGPFYYGDNPMLSTKLVGSDIIPDCLVEVVPYTLEQLAKDLLQSEIADSERRIEGRTNAIDLDRRVLELNKEQLEKLKKLKTLIEAGGAKSCD